MSAKLSSMITLNALLCDAQGMTDQAIRQCDEIEDERDEARAAAQAAISGAWIWQAEGNDLDSMSDSMPVTLTAGMLRKMLAQAAVKPEPVEPAVLAPIAGPIQAFREALKTRRVGTPAPEPPLEAELAEAEKRGREALRMQYEHPRGSPESKRYSALFAEAYNDTIRIEASIKANGTTRKAIDD